MSNHVEDRFYLTEWKPDDADGETRRLMEREGSDDGCDAIMAEFSRYPAPLGEHLAEAALKAALAYAEAGAEKDRDEAYRASMSRQSELKAALAAEKLVAMKLHCFKPAWRCA